MRINYPQRYKKALLYKSRKDYLRCIGAYILLDNYVGKFNEKDVKISENGKPSILGKPNFNYSHSGEYVVLVIDKKQPVGIDIQEIKNKDKEYIKEWTKKEAAVKLLGTGFKTLNDCKNLNTIDYKYTTFRFHKNYYISVARKRR